MTAEDEIMRVNDNALYDYAWGDSSTERDRLKRQADRLRLLTRRFLADAGIVPGMRVLEFGCGTGEFTLLLAEALGRDARIVALERSPVMLSQAQLRLITEGFQNVRFVQCDLDSSLPSTAEGLFDAVVGRLVLTHLVDSVLALRRAVIKLRPGGVVAFQEADFTLSDHFRKLYEKRLRLVNRVCGWIDLATQHSSMNRYMGCDIYRTFKRAGLPGPTLHFHTEVHGGSSEERIRNTVEMIRNLKPRLEELGISPREIDIDTLEDRLRAETSKADVVQARSSIVSAWAVKPESAQG